VVARRRIPTARAFEEKSKSRNSRVRFLHGLGEAFANDPAGDLHRLIVEGATRILDARGGALYMVDRPAPN